MSKLENLYNRAKYAHMLAKMLEKGVGGQLVVAGGLVRDIWALEQGIDFKGSGDIDLLLINNTDDDLVSLANGICEVIRDSQTVTSCEVTDVTYSYEKSEEYPDADDRLYGVMQFRAVRPIYPVVYLLHTTSHSNDNDKGHLDGLDSITYFWSASSYRSSIRWYGCAAAATML